jgi:hypothetical protein
MRMAELLPLVEDLEMADKMQWRVPMPWIPHVQERIKDERVPCRTVRRQRLAPLGRAVGPA